jgi:hypothetical protein
MSIPKVETRKDSESRQSLWGKRYKQGVGKIYKAFYKILHININQSPHKWGMRWCEIVGD